MEMLQHDKSLRVYLRPLAPLPPRNNRSNRRTAQHLQNKASKDAPKTGMTTRLQITRESTEVYANGDGKGKAITKHQLFISSICPLANKGFSQNSCVSSSPARWKPADNGSCILPWMSVCPSPDKGDGGLW